MKSTINSGIGFLLGLVLEAAASNTRAKMGCRSNDGDFDTLPPCQYILSHVRSCLGNGRQGSDCQTSVRQQEISLVPNSAKPCFLGHQSAHHWYLTKLLK